MSAASFKFQKVSAIISTLTVLADVCVCSTFPGGDQCGEPLCSTLRVTIDADVYSTAAYTTSSTATPAAIQDADCAATLIWANLDTGCAGNPLGRLASGPRTGNSSAQMPDPNNQPQVGMYDVSTAAYGGYQDATTANYGGYHDGTASTYYPAQAIVISGSITSQSGQKHGCYSEGSIEVWC
jgi:hypothetical protein